MDFKRVASRKAIIFSGKIEPFDSRKVHVKKHRERAKKYKPYVRLEFDPLLALHVPHHVSLSTSYGRGFQ